MHSLKFFIPLIFILELLVYLLFIPILKKVKISQAIRADGPTTHLRKSGTPTMGGIIFTIFILIFYFLICYINNIKINLYDNLIILISILGYGILGLVDDYLIIIKNNNKGISPTKKFLIQLLIALIIYGLLILSGHQSIINIFGKKINLTFLYGVFIMFYYVAVANSVNLSDGLDGLASGIIITILIGTLIYSYYLKRYDLFILSIISIIALLGFLIFNFHPAKIFMGNSGSMALGGLIASLFLLMEIEILLIIMGLALIIETLSDIIQVTYFKLTKGKRIFKMAPFHHHLELLSFSEWQIDLIFWSFSLVMSLIGVIMGVRLF